MQIFVAVTAASNPESLARRLCLLRILPIAKAENDAARYAAILRILAALDNQPERAL